MTYLIWSLERKGYWLHNGHGYTHEISQAMRCSESQAIVICRDSNLFPEKPPEDVMVPITWSE